MACSAFFGLMSCLLVSQVISYVAGTEPGLNMAIQVISAVVVILICALLHNTPVIADFVIATHIEVERVTWPSGRYVSSALRVTAFFVVGLVLTIMVIDVFWNLAESR